MKQIITNDSINDLFKCSISWKFFQHQTMISSSSVLYEHHQCWRVHCTWRVQGSFNPEKLTVLSLFLLIFFSLRHSLFHLFSSSFFLLVIHSLISQHLTMIVLSSIWTDQSVFCLAAASNRIFFQKHHSVSLHERTIRACFSNTAISIHRS
jgi:hypothetical protein